MDTKAKICSHVSVFIVCQITNERAKLPNKTVIKFLFRTLTATGCRFDLLFNGIPLIVSNLFQEIELAARQYFSAVECDHLTGHVGRKIRNQIGGQIG